MAGCGVVLLAAETRVMVYLVALEVAVSPNVLGPPHFGPRLGAHALLLSAPLCTALSLQGRGGGGGGRGSRGESIRGVN